MNDKIKIYSLNLMSYIQLKTGLTPKLFYQYDKDKGQKWYGVFEKSEEVEDALFSFKYDTEININLREFLDNLHELMNRRKNIQEDLAKWN